MRAPGGGGAGVLGSHGGPERSPVMRGGPCREPCLTIVKWPPAAQGDGFFTLPQRAGRYALRR